METSARINLTDLASQKLDALLLSEVNKDSKLRISIESGGCTGFKYRFALDKIIHADDVVIENAVLVNCQSMQLLDGATLDYKEDLSGSGFFIDNPKAKATCGCGSSFAIE
jgi:iron-sulfur cluster insertion protein